jgi:hypothetical protein
MKLANSLFFLILCAVMGCAATRNADAPLSNIAIRIEYLYGKDVSSHTQSIEVRQREVLLIYNEKRAYKRLSSLQYRQLNSLLKNEFNEEVRQSNLRPCNNCSAIHITWGIDSELEIGDRYPLDLSNTKVRLWFQELDDLFSSVFHDKYIRLCRPIG